MALSVRGDVSLDATSPLFPDPESRRTAHARHAAASAPAPRPPRCPFSPLYTRSGGGPVFPASSVYPVKRERG
jgi:hypothetical protein